MKLQIFSDELNSIHLVESSKKSFRKRVLFIIMSFLGFFNIFTMRVDLSVAIVAMVKSGNLYSNTFVILSFIKTYTEIVTIFIHITDTDQKTNITEGCPIDIQENSKKIDSVS